MRCLICLAKMRSILCVHLASLLRYVERPSPTYDDIAKNDVEEIIDESFATHLEPKLVQAGALSDPVLIDIRDILRKKSLVEDEARARERNEATIKRDWILAARVFNRLCFIFFTTVLIVVNLIFFLVFHLSH